MTYTKRRVRRLEAASRALGLKPQRRRSAALPGLIADAFIAAGKASAEVRDAEILGAIEPISHYGLAVYTAIDRYLRGAQAINARKILAPSLKEKRDAIAEMKRMGNAQAATLRAGLVRGTAKHR